MNLQIQNLQIMRSTVFTNYKELFLFPYDAASYYYIVLACSLLYTYGTPILPSKPCSENHIHTNLPLLLLLPLILISILHKSDYTEFTDVFLYWPMKLVEVSDHVLVHVYNLYCAYYVPGYMSEDTSHTKPCLVLQESYHPHFTVAETEA